jgi:hypothetical protein
MRYAGAAELKVHRWKINEGDYNLAINVFIQPKIRWAAGNTEVFKSAGTDETVLALLQ